MTTSSARVVHAMTALIAWAALVLQLVLVIKGGRVLEETEQPTLSVRLARLISYFTIESNLLVAITTTQLARDPLRDGGIWRVARLAAVVGITITGVVHFVALRPLLHLHGADWLADKLLHLVVPLVAVVGWALFGPRPRVTGRVVGIALCWPVVWLAWTLVIGWLSGWYPYPFLDHRLHGSLHVLGACLLVTLLFLACFGLAALVDRRVRPAPAPAPAGTVGA